MLESLLSADDVASILGITRKTLRKHVRNGEIAFVETGAGRIRPSIAFTQDDVERFIESRRKRHQAASAEVHTSLSSAGFTSLRAAKEARKQSK